MSVNVRERRLEQGCFIEGHVHTKIDNPAILRSSCDVQAVSPWAHNERV